MPHRAPRLHRALQPARIEIHLHAALARKIQIPIHRPDEQAAPDHVADRGRDQRFPDVVAHADPRRPVPDADRDEEHVRDAVVQAERDERGGREPDGAYCGVDFAAAD